MAAGKTGEVRPSPSVIDDPDLLRQVRETVPLMVRKLDGTILYWSGGMARLYGFSAAEAVGRSAFDLLQSVLPEPLGHIMARLMDGGHWTGETIHRTADGQRRVAFSQWSLFRGRDAAPRAVAVIHTDVSELSAGREKLARLATLIE